MASKFGKFFESLIYEDDGTTQQAEQPQTQQQVTQQAPQSASVSSTPVQQPNLTIGSDGKLQYTGKVRETFARLMLDCLVENDIPGPDYRELKDSYENEDMKSNIPDPNTRWKSCFSMMKMMNKQFTKKVVLDSINTYVSVIDREKANAMAQIDQKDNDTVGEKGTQLADTENRIMQAEEEIKKLQEKINKINESISADKNNIIVLKREIETAQQEIFMDKADLEATATAIKNNLLADKQTLESILPND